MLYSLHNYFYKLICNLLQGSMHAILKVINAFVISMYSGLIGSVNKNMAHALGL